jgi:hypothetical protein
MPGVQVDRHIRAHSFGGRPADKATGKLGTGVVARMGRRVLLDDGFRVIPQMVGRPSEAGLLTVVVTMSLRIEGT